MFQKLNGICVLHTLKDIGFRMCSRFDLCNQQIYLHKLLIVKASKVKTIFYQKYYQFISKSN